MPFALLPSLLNDSTGQNKAAITCRQINVPKFYQQEFECLASPGLLNVDYEFCTKDFPEFPNQLLRPTPTSPSSFIYPWATTPINNQ